MHRSSVEKQIISPRAKHTRVADARVARKGFLAYSLLSGADVPSAAAIGAGLTVAAVDCQEQ